MLFAHKTTVPEIAIFGIGEIVMMTVSRPGGQPWLPVVSSMSMTKPEVISKDEGVYRAFKVIFSGLKLPVPFSQIPPVAPSMLPFN